MNRRRWIERTVAAASGAALAALWCFRPANAAGMAFLLAAGYAAAWIGAGAAIGGGARFWSKRAAATTLGLCLTAGLLELASAVRLVDFRSVFGVAVDEPWRHPVNRLDDELLHVRKPNARLRGVQRGGDIAFYTQIENPREYRYDVQYDANGFRNRPANGPIDIAVIGDSFVEAFGVADEDLVTTRLAALRNRPVANFGQIWYGPQQQLAVLRRFVLPLQPSLCVWCVFEGNDLSDLKRYEEIKADWPNRRARLESALERSFTRNALLTAFARWGRPPAKPPGSAIRGVISRGRHAGNELYFYYPGRRVGAEDEAALSKLVDILRTADSICRESGIRFLAAVVPTKFRVYGRLCEFRPDSPCNDWVESDLARRLKKALSEGDPPIPVVDLAEGFKAESESRDLLYFVDDTHWSPAGHQLAAELFDKAMREFKP